MSPDVGDLGRWADGARFRPGQRAGHYESWFSRANHPTRPLAFWIRYTLFSPAGHPERGLGELWAVVFDGETGRHVAVKREAPIARAHFRREELAVDVDGAALRPGSLAGQAERGGHRVAWDLRVSGDAPPLLLLPRPLYATPLPKAKMLVGRPLARFEGALEVDGRPLDVTGWAGSQNHNWGSKHTDDYAWGQVAGFDGAPESFLEVGTGRLKIGPLWTPYFTPLVLRHAGREHSLNARSLLGARGAIRRFDWTFASQDAEVRVEGRVHADHADFVGLAYANPPGGIKACLNTKIASCDLTVTYRAGPRAGQIDRLRAARRAAFEILTDDQDHGVPMLA